MGNRRSAGHLAALFTIIIWGTTFISTKVRANFFIGFVVAMAGVALISFNGSRMELNPAGDVLAVLAAFVWACYSILTRKISSFAGGTGCVWRPCM